MHPSNEIEKLKREIERLKKAEIIAKENEKKHKAIINSIQDVVFMLDSFTIIECNTRANKTLRYQTGELINGSIFKIFPKETKSNADYHNSIESYFRAPENFDSSTIWKFQRKDGSIFDGKMILSEVKTNEKTYTIVIVQDITAILKEQEQCIKAKEHAEESDRLKSAFLANMSHEIRTPMNSIIGFSALLEDRDLTVEKQRDYIEIIKSSGNQLLTIISDIIDISKIEANQIDILIKPYNINELIDELQYQIENEQLIHLRKNVKIITHKELPSKESILHTDEVRLRQILLNLLDNAVKFTQEGTIELGYKLLDNQRLIFFVKDTGIGISAENLKLIFNHFRQVEEHEIRQYGGTGLGLAICKGLVELLDGDIWVESQPGKGTRFYFSHPYKPHVESAYIKQKEATVPVPDFSGYKVLIVDDIELIHRYFMEILEQTKIEIIHAYSGREAVMMCDKDSEISVVLMDIQLPDISGLEATHMIKEVRPDIKIIAQTAYALAGDEDKAKLAGCDNYISKPVKPIILYTIMKEYLPPRSTS